jgi:hypothetical protein
MEIETRGPFFFEVATAGHKPYYAVNSYYRSKVLVWDTVAPTETQGFMTLAVKWTIQQPVS